MGHRFVRYKIIVEMAEHSQLTPVRADIAYLRHQEEGIRWMLEREAVGAAICRGGILADDMGLGKTFQTIGLLKNTPEYLTTLILCPPALIAGWTAELKSCGFNVAFLLQSAAWSTGKSGEKGGEKGNTVWLTSYPKACLYANSIAATGFQRVILDEGHVVRNGKATTRWMRCMTIAAVAQCRWILSATPVQNGLSDWRNLCAWLRVTCKASEVASQGTCDSIMLRRTMAQLRSDSTVCDLPPSPRFLSHDLSIPAEGKEGQLFRILSDQLENAVENKSTSVLLKLEMWMRIQQFMVHPQIYIEAMRNKFGGGYPRPDWTHGCTKWNAVMEVLTDAVKENIGTIVFCNFRAEMDRVAEAAGAMGACVFSIRGGMTSEAVGDAVACAKEGVAAGKPVVVVVQIVSGGAGLNLQFCRRILFVSQHWNPAVVHQAVGRAVRIGQRSVVDIHMFRVVDDVIDNIDRRMIQVHLAKIRGARKICQTLYEGYAPLREIPSVRITATDRDVPQTVPQTVDPADENPRAPLD